MNKKFYIIHGYGADSSSNFFPWLKNKLNQQNYFCDILDLPNTDFPKLDEWINYMNQNIVVDENTYIIAHSLGCIATLKYIDKFNLATIKGIYLVSGFDESLPLFPQLDSFTKIKINYQKVIEKINLRYVIASKDDDLVPFKSSEKLAKNISAKFVALDNYGHFLVEQVSEIYELIKNQ